MLLIPCAKEVLSSLKKKGLKVGIVTGRTTPGEMKWLELCGQLLNGVKIKK